MAHSLRSKSKKVSKKIKCSNPNSDYFKTAKERAQRLAEKLKGNLEQQKTATVVDADDESKMQTDDNENADSASVNAEELLKVKTHGWRKSRSQDYKKKKISKRNKSIKF